MSEERERLFTLFSSFSILSLSQQQQQQPKKKKTFFFDHMRIAAAAEICAERGIALSNTDPQGHDGLEGIPHI